MRFGTLPLLLALAAPAAAQTVRAPAEPATRPVLTAGTATGPIHVDGHFDEPAWTTAEAATAFTQSYPNPGGKPSQPTEVRVLVGSDALYVAARMFDAHPDSIAAQLARRDVFGTYSDRILLFVDSHDDRRTGFHFGVNPRGVKQDTYLYDDTREDASWSAVWDVATTVDSLGWTAEFRIPFSQLRFGGAAGSPRTWGFGVMREVARYQERDSWAPWTRNSPGFVSAFGELRGLDAVRPPQRLEIVPYTSARLERAPGDRANPFYSSNHAVGSVGADVQYGLPAGLTLTATINPDFGQVEADPAEVNLTAFETFFPEQRPFFVEGSDIFRFGDLSANNTYGFSEFFYTRRVGRTPQRTLGGGEFRYATPPASSTILGAAKVSGKTAGGWSLGLLDAVTGREMASYLDTAGVERATPVEPLTNYLVTRFRRDANQGNTVIGGIATAANRQMGGAGVFSDLLRSSAYLGGLDAQHSWGRRAWTVSGYLAASKVLGSRSVITGTQLSSARYYQRPDADYLSLDTTRTSLGGTMGALALNRSGSWDGSLAYEFVSPGFEINDLGFQGRVDYRAFSTYLGRRVNRAGNLFRSYNVAAYSNHAWNYGGDNVYAGFGASAGATFRNLWAVSASGIYSPGYVNDRLTRGGPVGETPRQWSATLKANTDTRRRWSLATTLKNAQDPSGMLDRSVGLGGTLRPSTSLQVTLQPTFRWRRNTDQYVQRVGDELAATTFRSRYVFADVEQTIVSLDTRVDWTFTPNLSLQVYAQPFVNSGKFSRYKEFATPGTFDFAVYGRDRGTIAANQACGASAGAANVFTVDPDGTGPAGCFQVPNRDFNFRSLRGNAVLRWEYRPGSALFFVWQQVRSEEEAYGSFSFRRDAGAAFRAPAQNVFLIKATYWLGR
jgi:hypothetical protein